MIAAAALLRRPSSGIAATGVERVTDPALFAGFFGCALIQVHAALCYPTIEAHDVLEVDFDHREVRQDGLYLMALDNDTDECAAVGDRWFGARHFQFMPGGLLVREAGPGSEWIRVTPALRQRMTIFGLVREVYKPARGHMPAVTLQVTLPEKARLTPEQLAEITGRERKVHQLQWLREHQWLFELDASGALVVGSLYAHLRLAGLNPVDVSLQDVPPGFDLNKTR